MPTCLLYSSASGKNRPHLHGSLFSNLASASHATEMALSKVISGLLTATPGECASLLTGLRSVLTASLIFSWFPRPRFHLLNGFTLTAQIRERIQNASSLRTLTKRSGF